MDQKEAIRKIESFGLNAIPFGELAITIIYEDGGEGDLLLTEVEDFISEMTIAHNQKKG